MKITILALALSYALGAALVGGITTFTPSFTDAKVCTELTITMNDPTATDLEVGDTGYAWQAICTEAVTVWTAVKTTCTYTAYKGEVTGTGVTATLKTATSTTDQRADAVATWSAAIACDTPAGSLTAGYTCKNPITITSKQFYYYSQQAPAGDTTLAGLTTAWATVATTNCPATANSTATASSILSAAAVISLF